MADLLITGIATEAPSLADDDYVELGGATNGTRKLRLLRRLLAGDYSRQVRDSIYFDALTAGARGFAQLGSTGAIGSSPFTMPWLVFVDGSDRTGLNPRGIYSLSNTATDYDAGSLSLYRAENDLVLNLRKVGGGATDRRLLTVASFFTTRQAGWVLVHTTWSRTAAPTLYADGQVLTAVETSTGTPPAWTDVCNATYLLAGIRSNTEIWSSLMVPMAPINAVLTAPEILRHAVTGELPDWCSVGNGSMVAATSGTLRVGWKYRIASYVAGDSFTNVGASSNSTGVEFLAIATTPTTWTNSSQLIPLGPLAKWVFQPGCPIATDSGENKTPFFLTPGAQAVGRMPEIIALPSQIFSADGFLAANQNVVPAGYEMFACAVCQLSGTSTGTVTVRRTSSGGSTLATGALAGAAGLVSLTATPTVFATADKLHVSCSSYAGGTTFTVRLLARRIY